MIKCSCNSKALCKNYSESKIALSEVEHARTNALIHPKGIMVRLNGIRKESKLQNSSVFFLVFRQSNGVLKKFASQWSTTFGSRMRLNKKEQARFSNGKVNEYH